MTQNTQPSPPTSTSVLTVPIKSSTEDQVKLIQMIVAEHFGVTIHDILCNARMAHYVKPRQIAMYFTRTLLKLALSHTAYYFKRQDHGTVIHACKAVKTRFAVDKNYAADINRLRERLTALLSIENVDPQF